MSKIYLDNNATTKLDPRVVEAMLTELQAEPSNPSSIHSFGRSAAGRLQKARKLIADYLGVHESELIFTSSGTEAIHLAILGLKPKGHIITTKIEHAAVFHTIENLPNPVAYLPVNEAGHVLASDVENAIHHTTSLIVLSAVNSETGVKNPIEEIASIAKRYGIPLIVDGVALLGKEIFSIPSGITAMTFSAHKIHGPKGIGLLFLRKGTKFSPLFLGGGQEAMRRAGTENLPGVIGFAKAVEILQSELPAATHHMEHLRNLFESQLVNVRINGSGPRICNTSNITFLNHDGEAMLIKLDQKGIAASMGSACSSGVLRPSRPLQEMGLSRKEALSSIRFSLSRFTTEEEIQKVLNILSELQFSSVPG